MCRRGLYWVHSGIENAPICYSTIANELAETGQTPVAAFQQATRPQKSDAIIPADPVC